MKALPAAPAVSIVDAPAAPSRRRLLVVDDDRLVLATLVQGLEDAGYEVLDADNGDDAILLARQHKPVLALLDIRMDGLSGFDVAAYLREHLRIPFMFLSAFNDAATLAQIEALGALASLVKPLDLAQIVPAVDAAYAQALALRDGGDGAPAGDGEEIADTGDAATTHGAADGHGRVVQPVMPAASPAAHSDSGALALAQPVALAVGILMHRYSLRREAALVRLRQLALSEGRSLEACGTALVAAVEQLSLPG